MCTVLLPLGVNPIAVNKYIISYISDMFQLFIKPFSGCNSKGIFDIELAMSLKYEI
jgi:hypothetical protein